MLTHPLPEGTVPGICHSPPQDVVDFGICMDTHVKSIAPSALYIPYATVPVFVNAVKSDSNGIFYVEQERKDSMAVEAPRFLPDNTVQPAV